MKHLQKWGGAGFALLLLLLTASGTFAQTTTRYIDPANGSGTACTLSAPCTLLEAYKKTNADGTLFLIRVPVAGGKVSLAPPNSENALTEKVRFGTYVQGNAAAVEGTIRFSSTTRPFRIASSGQFQLHAKAKVEFRDVIIGGNWFFLMDGGAEERITMNGTLTINSIYVALDKLVVSGNMTVKARDAGASILEIYNGLTVTRGSTLKFILNDRGDRLTTYLRLRKGTSSTDTKGLFTVHGTVQGYLNTIAISSTNKNNRGDGSDFIPTSMYDPSNGVDHNDCLRITGTGEIYGASLRIPGRGNVCVDLKRIHRLIVGGSIVEENSGRKAKNITTDVIFRQDVVIDHNVQVYGDARVVFEKGATIKGLVELEGSQSSALFPSAGELGPLRTASVRKGIQMGTSGNYTCAYVPRRTDKKPRAAHIPGIQFHGQATIEGDLRVGTSALTETTSHATQASTACAPRVLFLAPAAKTSGSEGVQLVSRIGGTVMVEDTADFHDKGRIHLDSDNLETSNVMRRTAHNVHVEGDLSAKGNTIGMAYPSTSSIDGMCMTKDTELTFGNHIVLAAANKHVISGQNSGVMLSALVALGDLDAQDGTLTVKTLHVGPRAELTATKDVKVTESLILQGELSGELDETSMIKRLTYGSGATDVVKKVALTSMLDALAIHAGSGELRLDEVYKTKNLGLCSGTLSLVDAESTTDSTLHVTEQITVENGMLVKDANDPGSLSTDIMTKPDSNDRYMLTYITPGAREVKAGDLEWFDPRDVIVNHAKAEIMAPDGRSLPGKLTITKGKLTVDGMLTVGTSPLHRTDATEVGRYSVEVAAGELHTRGQDVMVHGKVTVSGKSKLMTGGGDLHVLGRVSSGEYAHNTALVSIAKEAMVDLGDGMLMLGPEDTKKRNNVRDLDGYNKGTDGNGANSRPDVKLTLTGSLKAGMINIPKGSKETVIDASTDSKMLQTVVFDGTRTPKLSGTTENDDGLLRILSASAAGKMLTIDSLSAMQGAVETHNKKVVITDAVTLRSATIWPYAETTEFMGDLMISGTGGLNTEHNGDNDQRSVMIHGDFTQSKGTISGDLAGVKLHPMTTKTVMGDLMVAADASRYIGKTVSGKMPSLVVHGGFHFAKKGDLDVQVEFKGEEGQEVMTGDTTALHSVTVNNAKGLLLKSHVMQQKMATLTLRQGKIHSMPMDSMFMWTVQNVQVEQELRGRSSAQTGEKCGADNDEECKATILRGSRQSYIGGPVARHLLQGNAGAGFASGGYLFPVGMQKGDMSHYRPLILQLPSDLTDTTAATVSPVMVPEGAMPAWQNLTVPTAGGSLALDVHADLFWKVDLGTESLPTNTNLRIAAEGLQNVADASGLRIVQWDCMWKNPKLAGRIPAQADASSFAVNGYLNGVVHLTQEGIGLGSCAIFGIAANGIENPIDQGDLSGGRANLQFIHNVPLPTSVDLHLGDIQIGSGIQFRHATAYRPVGAGSHELKIQEVGAPVEDAITSTLALSHNKNYVVIAHGSPNDTRLKVLETRMTSQVANQVDVLLVHGSADLGAARVEVLDPIDPMTVKTTLAGNLMLNDATRRYASLAPSQQIFRVQSTDQEVTQAYEMDLYGYANQTLVLNLSGMRNDLTILGVDRNGMIIPTVVVTGVEESAELPTEFALHGNYPNPFNPSTRIQFDLPENAQVQIQIVDMLGREVITLPAQEVEAGANRSLELNATSLASGTYLYRLIAKGAEQRHVKTGRMTLVK